MSTDKEAIIDQKSPQKAEEEDEDKGLFRCLLPSYLCRKECQMFLQLTGSAYVVIGVRVLFPIISVIMVGQLGRTELAAVSLANTVISFSCTAIMGGFSFAIDTILGQTHSQEDIRSKLGTIVQRIYVLLSVFTLLLVSVIINMEVILLAIGQNPVIAKMSGYYLLVWLPCAFLEFNLMLMNRYLLIIDCQLVLVISSVIALIFNISSQYLLQLVLHKGYLMSALCQVLSYIIMLVIDIGYIRVTGVCAATWEGVQWRQAMQNWAPCLKQMLFGGAVNIVSYAVMDVGMLVAGVLGIDYLAEFGILYNIAIIMSMVPTSLGTAVNIMLAKYLGENNWQRVKPFLKTSYLLLFFLLGCIVVILIALQNVLPVLFSKDETVSAMASRDMIYLAISLFISGVAFYNSCVIFSTARRVVILVVIYFAQCFIGLPIIFILVWKVKFKVNGILIGFIAGTLVEGLIYTVVIVLTEWQNYTQLGNSFQISVKQRDSAEKEKLLGDESGAWSKWFVMKLFAIGFVVLILMTSVVLRCTTFNHICISNQNREYLENKTADLHFMLYTLCPV